MKKFISVLLCLALCLASLTACGAQAPASEAVSEAVSEAAAAVTEIAEDVMARVPNTFKDRMGAAIGLALTAADSLEVGTSMSAGFEGLVSYSVSKPAEDMLTMSIHSENEALNGVNGDFCLVRMDDEYLCVLNRENKEGSVAPVVLHYDINSKEAKVLFGISLNNSKEVGETEIDLSQNVPGISAKLVKSTVENEDGSFTKTQSFVDAEGNALYTVNATSTFNEDGRLSEGVSTDGEGNELMRMDTQFFDSNGGEGASVAGDTTTHMIETYTDVQHGKTVTLDIPWENGKALLSEAVKVED